MTFRGDLADVSLPTLIQLLCGKQSRCGLVLQGPQGAGELFFDNGTLVAAKTGATQGDAAVYTMLDWDDRGRFQVVEDMTFPEPSVTTSWSTLLMNASLETEQRRYEEAVADSLVGLLSTIEHRAIRLSGCPPREAMADVVDILNTVAALGGDDTLPIDEGHRLDAHLAAVGAGALILGAIDNDAHRVDAHRVDALLETRSDDQRAETFQQISGSLIDAAERMVNQLIEGFPPAPRTAWSEAWDELLEAVRGAVETAARQPRRAK